MQYAFDLFFRVVLSYSILWLGLRFLGKKQFGELTVVNVATASAVGEMAADFATQMRDWPNTYVFAMFGYFFLTFGVGWVSLKSRPLREIFEGTPTPVIAHGKVLEGNLRKMNMSVDLLLEKLREKNAFRVEEVEYALMEADGKMSLMFMPPYGPLTADTIKVPTQYKGLMVDVVADGKMLAENLRKVGLTQSWLTEQLKKQHISAFEDVFLAQIDENGKLYIDLMKDWKEGKEGGKVN